MARDNEDKTGGRPNHPPDGKSGREAGHGPVESPASPSVDSLKVVRELFRKYGRAVFAFFLRRDFSREDARELAQETFLRVHMGREAYRHKSEWNYLLTIANNVRLNAIRARRADKREGQTSPIEDVDDFQGLKSREPSPEDRLLKKERIEFLRKTIEELPGQMQQCLKMRIDGDLKYREIALALGISLDTVKKTLYQARRLFKEKVGSWVDSQFPE